MSCRCAVIVPCFNEAHRLSQEPFVAYAAANRDVGIWFINDGSRDSTADVLGSCCQRQPSQFRLISLKQNSGKAEAVRTGILAAISAASPDFVGYMDADLSAPLTTIDLLRQSLESNPQLIAAIGSRVKLHGCDINRRLWRHLAGRVFATCASLALRLPVYDTQCGAKLFRVNEAIRQAFATPFINRWSFDVELLLRLRNLAPAGFFYECPVRQWHDVGPSHVSPSAGALALFSLVRLWAKYARSSRNPRANRCHFRSSDELYLMSSNLTKKSAPAGNTGSPS